MEIDALRWSADLLVRSDLAVTRVAQAVGISEAELGKLYRAEHGMSPQAFRLRARR